MKINVKCMPYHLNWSFLQVNLKHNQQWFSGNKLSPEAEPVLIQICAAILGHNDCKSFSCYIVCFEETQLWIHILWFIYFQLKQGPVQFIWPIPWLLMAWWHAEPGISMHSIGMVYLNFLLFAQHDNKMVMKCHAVRYFQWVSIGHCYWKKKWLPTFFFSKSIVENCL